MFAFSPVSWTRLTMSTRSTATKANEEPTVDADAADGEVQTEQDKEVVATVVTDVVAPTTA